MYKCRDFISKCRGAVGGREIIGCGSVGAKDFSSLQNQCLLPIKKSTQQSDTAYRDEILLNIVAGNWRLLWSQSIYLFN